MAGVPLQQQKIDDDYELWDPRNREDTRKGKGFVVSIACILYFKQINQKKPLQYIGAALGIGAVGYMARNFKNRPAHIRPSVYLIHTRLLAQGLVVGESVPSLSYC